MRDRSNQRNHGEYAVIVLTKTVKVERDHLIHREAVPLPYEGKALTRSKLCEIANVRRCGNALLAANRKVRSPSRSVIKSKSAEREPRSTLPSTPHS